MVHEGLLFAGGVFETAGNLSVSNVAAWDGDDWCVLVDSTGPDNRVISLASYQGDLYVGGDFETIGKVAANQIARWDGANWFEVGNGLSSDFWPSVIAMTVFEDQLILGGWFTHAGGQEVSYVVGWDGTSWQPLDLGLPNFVWALTVHDGELYAGGDFDLPGYLVKWNGTTWKAHSAPLNGQVRGLESYSNHLYAAGLFTLAGNSSSFYIARWDDATMDVGDDPLDLYADGSLSFTAPGILIQSAGARFCFALNTAADVSLDLFDLEGRRLLNLARQMLPPGSHEINWSAVNTTETSLSPGIYYARLTAGPFTATRKFMLIR